ncbi:unnamed protein product, partial [Amoebophrya sp. A120]|eukprot:GSA120T00013995001.1
MRCAEFNLENDRNFGMPVWDANRPNEKCRGFQVRKFHPRAGAGNFLCKLHPTTLTCKASPEGDNANHPQYREVLFDMKDVYDRCRIIEHGINYVNTVFRS